MNQNKSWITDHFSPPNIVCVCVKIWIHTYTTYINIYRYVPVQYLSLPAFLWRISLHRRRPVQPWLKSESIMLSALQPIQQSGVFRPSMTPTFTSLLEHYERPNTNTNSRWWDMLIILNSCEICVMTSAYQSKNPKPSKLGDFSSRNSTLWECKLWSCIYAVKF